MSRYYVFTCPECGHTESRHANAKKCAACGGSVHRLADSEPLRMVEQGMTLLIAGLLLHRPMVERVPPLSVDIMHGPTPPYFFTTVGNEWRCFGGDGHNAQDAIAKAVAEAIDHLSDPDAHYVPDPIHADQVEIACAAFYESKPSLSAGVMKTGEPAPKSWREYTENGLFVDIFRSKMKAALRALLGFSRRGYSIPRNAERSRAIDNETKESHMDRADLIVALRPLIGHWCRAVTPSPVPYVHDFMVVDLRILGPGEKDTTTHIYGCDILLWDGQHYGPTPTGLAIPSKEVASAEWSDNWLGLRMRGLRQHHSISLRPLGDRIEMSPVQVQEEESAHG